MLDVNNCPLVKNQGLLISVCRPRPIASLSEVMNRSVAQFGALEMVGERGRHFVRPLGVETFKRLGDRQVQLFAILFEQRIVRGVLRQGMTEEVLQLRLRSQQPDQTGRFERVELTDQIHPAFSITCSRTLAENCRPITEATRRICFASSGRRSMRAISDPCKLSGMSTSATSRLTIH